MLQIIFWSFYALAIVVGSFGLFRWCNKITRLLRVVLLKNATLEAELLSLQRMLFSTDMRVARQMIDSLKQDLRTIRNAENIALLARYLNVTLPDNEPKKEKEGQA